PRNDFNALNGFEWYQVEIRHICIRFIDPHSIHKHHSRWERLPVESAKVHCGLKWIAVCIVKNYPGFVLNGFLNSLRTIIADLFRSDHSDLVGKVIRAYLFTRQASATDYDFFQLIRLRLFGIYGWEEETDCGETEKNNTS